MLKAINSGKVMTIRVRIFFEGGNWLGLDRAQLLECWGGWKSTVSWPEWWLQGRSFYNNSVRFTFVLCLFCKSEIGFNLRTSSFHAEDHSLQRLVQPSNEKGLQSQECLGGCPGRPCRKEVHCRGAAVQRD